MFAIMKERPVKSGKGEAASFNLTKLFHIVMVTRFYESDSNLALSFMPRCIKIIGITLITFTFHYYDLNK